MIKTLNLVGKRQLKLIEDVENSQVQNINYVWLFQQFNSQGFTAERDDSKNAIVVKYDKKILEVIASYGNNNKSLFFEIKLQNTNKFPKVKVATETLQGNQLTSKDLLIKINQLIPSKVSLNEASLPNVSMNNAMQLGQVMNTLKKLFKVTEAQNDDSGIVYALQVKKLLTLRLSDLTITDYNNAKVGTYNDLTSLMSFVAESLGISDLTSQLFTENPQEDEIQQDEQSQENTQDNQEEQQQDETQQPKSYNFERTSALDKEYNELVNALEKSTHTTKAFLNALNEEYDPRHIGDWDQYYRTLGSEEDKMNLIKLFVNKKMNILADKVIGDNMRGLKSWVDQRGFDLNRNLGLQFVNNWQRTNGDKTIPTTALAELIYLSNDRVIQSNKKDLIDDPDSILYNDIYDTSLGYERLTNIIEMYDSISKSSLDEGKIEEIKEMYSFITANDPKSIAKQVVWDGSKLRDFDIITSLYQSLLGDEAQDFNKVSTKSDLNKLLKAIDNKNLDQVNTYDKESSNVITQAVNKSMQGDRQFYNTLSKEVQNIVSGGK